MRQRAPEPDTFLMGSNCVLAIATSSLRVQACTLVWSCRDAARRRCHEFRPDWIGDRFAQDPVDLSLDGRIKPPARHLVDRLQLVGMTRAPQRRCYTLIEHPADRQVNDALAEPFLRESIEPLHGGEILTEPGLPEFGIRAAEVIAVDKRLRPPPPGQQAPAQRAIAEGRNLVFVA